MAKQSKPRLGAAIRSAYRFQGEDVTPAAAPAKSKGKPPASRAVLRNLNVQVDVSLIDAVRDCVVALSGPPLFMTMARFAESACEREIERLQKEHNKGKPFPKRPAGLEVRRGRPVR